MISYEKWKQEYGLEHIRRCAADGLDDGSTAEALGIPLAQFKHWKKKYPEITDAQMLGRAGADYAVVESLYKKATGYTVNVDKTVKLKRTEYDPETGKKLCEYEELATATDQTHMPADMRAMLFWLKCRQPDRWSERPEAYVSPDLGGIVEMPNADLIDEEPTDE